MASPFVINDSFPNNSYITDPLSNILNQPMAPFNDKISNDEGDYIYSNEKVITIDNNERKIVVENLEIIRYILNSLSGKDKSAKILKYILEIVKLFIGNFIRRNQRANIDVKGSIIRYNFQNLKKYLLQPKFFLLILFTRINQNLNYITTQLGTYRYILRFGNSPFLVYNFIQKLKQIWSFDKTTKTFPQNCLELYGNEASLREILDLYYTVCDEMVVLYKFKVWSNPQLYNTITRHETLAWQYDILFSLKDVWFKLNDLKRKEMEYTIQLQVKEKAIAYYTKNMGHHTNMSPIRKQLLHDVKNSYEYGNEDDILKNKLENIKRDKNMAYLDLIKLSLDGCCNSIDVFYLKAPKVVYPLLSLGSGITSFVKLWFEAKDNLTKQKQEQ